MCAPNRIKMDESPIVARAHSQSSGGSTLVSGHDGPVSPLYSPDGTLNTKAGFNPVIQIGPDNRQWIDLEYVSPRLLKELRKQSAISAGYDQSSSFSKGAAKVKAWARQGKRGIDIRLRRTAGPNKDEVTDICLVPRTFANDEGQSSLPSELPEGERPVVFELQGDPIVSELPLVPDAGVARVASPVPSTADTLPRYEPPPHQPQSITTGDSQPVPQEHISSGPHQRSSSASSIVPTPARGLSVHKPRDSKDSLKSNPDDTRKQLQAEEESRKHFEQLLLALQKKLSGEVGNQKSVSTENTSETPILQDFKVAETTCYETETDAQPPSPPRKKLQRALSVTSEGSTLSPLPVIKPRTRGEQWSMPKPPVPGLRDPSSFTRPKSSGRSTFKVASSTKSTPSLRRQRDLYSSDDSDDSKSTRSQGQGTKSPSRTRGKPQARSSDITVRVSKPDLPVITTTFHPASKEPSPVSANVLPTPSLDELYNTWRPPHRPKNDFVILSGLVFASLTRSMSQGLQWVAQNLGTEPAVPHGKVRVRWTCSCGKQLYDDFEEKRPGAARELEAYLNRPRMHAGPYSNPTTPASAHGSHIFSSGSGPPSSQTSWGSFAPHGRDSLGEKPRNMQTYTGGTLPNQTWPPVEPPWLLTCANEDRYTPKLAHLDMAQHKITSDKELALSLRHHYFHINRKWWRSLRLRGLSTIEFVQLEVHQNRFADIRKCPDMPTSSQDYDFEPGDLMPPVGSTYLLHLFKHPEDYDGEQITYLRSPKKKTGRLSVGVGWGISLVEGFEASKVWVLVTFLFALASLVFAALWAWKKHDIQGAFGVAAWICTLAVLVVGWLQSCLG